MRIDTGAWRGTRHHTEAPLSMLKPDEVVQSEAYSATRVGEPSRVCFLIVQKTDSNSGNTVCTVGPGQSSSVQSGICEGFLRL